MQYLLSPNKNIAMIHTTKIYLLHRGDNIPFYIGKTTQPLKKRNKQHLENFGICYLEEIDEIPTSEWKFWECHYISLYKSWGFILKNTNKGGGGLTFMDEKSTDKIRNKLKNRIYKDEWKLNVSKATAGKTKNHPITRGVNISKAKKGISNPNLSLSRIGVPHPKKFRTLYQFDLTGVLIKEWKSEDIFNIPKFERNNIWAAARGKQKTSGGYVWKYENKINLYEKEDPTK